MYKMYTLNITLTSRWAVGSLHVPAWHTLVNDLMASLTFNFPEGTVYEYQFIFNGSLREPDNIHIDILITVHNGNPAIIM